MLAKSYNLIRGSVQANVTIALILVSFITAAVKKKWTYYVFCEECIVAFTCTHCSLHSKAKIFNSPYWNPKEYH